MFENINSTNIQIIKYEEQISIRAETHFASSGCLIDLKQLDKNTDILLDLLDDIRNEEEFKNKNTIK
jgi:hypothetical protein